MNKSNIDDKSQEEVVLEITDSEMPTVFEALKIYGKEAGLEEKECLLAIDLHKALNDNPDSVEGLLDNYFDKNKKKDKIENTFDKDLEEIIEYFGE